MVLKHKVLIFASSLVGMGVGSLGLGIAHAQTTTNPPAVTQTANQTSGGADSPEAPAKASAETDGPGGHQDPNGVNVDGQFGSQTGPDVGGGTEAGN